MKHLIGKRIHRKVHLLIDGDDTNIRLGDVGIDLHFGQVVRDHENDRSLQARSHRLANIDTTGDDRAINRRHDGAMVQIGLRLVERTLLDFHVRFSLMQICQRLIELGLGRILFRNQGLSSRGINSCKFQGSLGAR